MDQPSGSIARYESGEDRGSKIVPVIPQSPATNTCTTGGPQRRCATSKSLSPGARRHSLRATGAGALERLCRKRGLGRGAGIRVRVQ
ncbi:hypothetical protein E1J23_03125 [Xanthomonas gardneri]|nr:hypothetical protein [Xanthomonas hortorum pv. gardneri]